ncbi:Bug family tripartite tricarboxylate transporter substrate binding protein [Roseomonas sp. BN140053]|uniref:Bug family tripartite tricarboxylate transporter substrate binding protein n=1 Tax=Roseomonas sp. BN140053 TaxID=3391898 RepID=UPI0039E96E49
MTDVTRRGLGRLAAGSGLAMGMLGLPLPRGAAAQGSFPDHPIRLIVTTPPGGNVNGIARIIAEQFGRAAGQPMIVDNRPGAGGTIAEQVVLRSPPDGYTVLFSTLGALVTNAFTYPQSANNARDFTAIGMATGTPLLLMSHVSLPVRDVPELVAYARQHPDEVTFATSGIGTLPHLFAERFSRSAGVRMLHVPYQGGSAQLTDVLAGRTKIVFESQFNGIPMIQSGNVRGLAITAERRTTQLPEVPTMAESGFPDLTYTFWTGMAVSSAVPEPVQSRLSELLNQALRAPETAQALGVFGVEPMAAVSAAEFRALLERERAAWRPIAEPIAASMRG